MRTSGDDFFNAAGEFMAREQDVPPAGETFEADIGPQAHDFPLQAAAGVRLAQQENVVQV